MRKIVFTFAVTQLLSFNISASSHHIPKERYFGDPPKKHRHHSKKALAKAAIITTGVVGNFAIDELKSTRLNK